MMMDLGDRSLIQYRLGMLSKMPRCADLYSCIVKQQVEQTRNNNNNYFDVRQFRFSPFRFLIGADAFRKALG